MIENVRGLLTGFVIGLIFSILTCLAGSYQSISLILVIIETAIPLSILGFLFERIFLRLGAFHYKLRYLILYWIIVFPFYRLLVDMFEFLRTSYLPSYYSDYLSLLMFLALQGLIGIPFTFGFFLVYSVIGRLLGGRKPQHSR